MSPWRVGCRARCRHTHDSAQVLFLSGLKPAFPQLLASINSKLCIWEGAGSGEVPFSEEDLSSPMNTCRDISVTICGPTTYNGCPASSFPCLTLRRRPPLPFESFFFKNLLLSHGYDTVTISPQYVSSLSLSILSFPLVVTQSSPIIFLQS